MHGCRHLQILPYLLKVSSGQLKLVFGTVWCFLSYHFTTAVPDAVLRDCARVTPPRSLRRRRVVSWRTKDDNLVAVSLVRAAIDDAIFLDGMGVEAVVYVPHHYPSLQTCVRWRNVRVNEALTRVTREEILALLSEARASALVDEEDANGAEGGPGDRRIEEEESRDSECNGDRDHGDKRGDGCVAAATAVTGVAPAPGTEQKVSSPRVRTSFVPVS